MSNSSNDLGNLQVETGTNSFDRNSGAADADGNVASIGGRSYRLSEVNQRQLLNFCNSVGQHPAIKQQYPPISGSNAVARFARYCQYFQNISGAPLPWELNPDDAEAVLFLEKYDTSQMPGWTDYCTSTYFSAEFQRVYIKSRNNRFLAIDKCLERYKQIRVQIPGAPLPGELTAADVPFVFSVNEWREGDKDWNTLKVKISAELQEELQNNNFWIATANTWFAKTDDRPSLFLSDTGEISEAGRTEFSKMLLDHSAEPTRNAKDQLLAAPAQVDAVDAVVESMKGFLDVLTLDMGDLSNQNEDFCRSKTICVLVGAVGIPHFRKLAKAIYDSEVREGVYSHYMACTDDELIADVIAARRVSGYPLAILRVAFPVMMGFLRREPNLGKVPPWFKGNCLMHLLKHVRLYQDLGGAPRLVVMYEGNFQIVPVPPEGMFQSLNSDINHAVKRTICEVLRVIAQVTKPKKKAEPGMETALNAAVYSLFSRIKPFDFPAPVELRRRPDLIIPPCVKVAACRPNSGFGFQWNHWVKPNVFIPGVAKLDLATGEIDSDHSITGADALIELPHLNKHSPDSLAVWKSIIPKRAEPKLPSELLWSYFRNDDDFGFKAGRDALINAIIIGDLIRYEVLGSAIGNQLQREYPIFLILPMGHTTAEATNQGKSLLTKTIANALIPNFGEPIVMKQSVDSPSQRMIASQLRQFGSLLLDEFFMPAPDVGHFLDQRGIQSLVTGGGVTPGEAYKNSMPLYAKHPLFMSAKFIESDNTDIINRSCFLFLHPLSASTKCSPEELAELGSGLASLRIRLSALCWIHRTGFIDKLRKTPLAQNIWRHDGHATIAKLLCPDVDQINGYLAAADKQARSQSEAADESGLKDACGIVNGFSPRTYFDNCSDATLGCMADECRNGKKLRLNEALRTMVEDRLGANRRYTDEARKIRENYAAQIFGKQLGDAGFKKPGTSFGKAGGWQMTFVPKEKSDLWSSGHKSAYVVVTFQENS